MREVETDIAIVGGGLAGFTSAITASELGLRCLIIEKASWHERGGTSRVAAQGFLTTTDAPALSKYLMSLSGNSGPSKVLNAVATEMTHNRRFVRSIGGVPTKIVGPKGEAEYPLLDPNRSVAKFSHGGETRDSALWALAEHEVIRREVPILYESSVVRLVRNLGRVQDALVEFPHNPITRVRTKLGVILASGGFAASQAAMKRLVPSPRFATAGSPHSTGDGIKLGTDVGASTWHLDSYAGPYLTFSPNSTESYPLSALVGGASCAYMVIDGQGERVNDETERSRHGFVLRNGLWCRRKTPERSFLIFDERLLALGPLHNDNSGRGWTSVVSQRKWSTTNVTEIRKGWIRIGRNPSELAQVLSVPKRALCDQIDSWNEYCRHGFDKQFGRQRDLHPFSSEAKLGAIELTPTFLNTMGGLRRDEHCRVIDTTGIPIPGLCSAGELGSMFSHRYQGAGNLGECLASGRIAVRTLAGQGQS